MITGAAYDMVNHRILIQKLYNIHNTGQNMLCNRRFYVELNNELSRWRIQKNGLPQGSVLSPILFNIYTNDQQLHDGARNFRYAYDLCVTAQYSSFIELERSIGDALDKLTQYYRSNSLRANPGKTQVTTFYLRNRYKTIIKSGWNKTKLENTLHPKNLGVTLDRTLGYKQHIHNTMKVTTCNNLLRKLSNSKWGANANTIRTTALALSYSVAEYAAPVWARSPQAQKLNTALKCTCRAVAGCLKPTNVEDLYLLAGIAPPDIRHPAERRPKSRNCFLHSVKPVEFSPKIIRLRRFQTTPHKVTVNLAKA